MLCARETPDDECYTRISPHTSSMQLVPIPFMPPSQYVHLFSSARSRSHYSVHTVTCVSFACDCVHCRYRSRRKPYARGVRSWHWDFARDRAHYNALYPRAWNTFELPAFGLRLVCRQISPIIPHNYSVRLSLSALNTCTPPPSLCS